MILPSTWTDRPVFDPAELAAQNLGLVGLVLSRLPRSTVFQHGRAELESTGRLGLMKAARTYDPERGAFTTFAAYRIRGEILDELRVAYGRSVRKKYRPTLVGIEHAAPVAVEVSRFDAEDRLGLHRALETLTPRDRELIANLFGLDTGVPVEAAEMARRNGVTRPRIYQRRSEILEKLRREMEG